MKYDAIIKESSNNPIEEVKMVDGSIIKCKKVPLATVESMDTFLVGVKKSLDHTEKALNYIATCGDKKLYAAVGDASTYLKNKQGHILSSSIDEKGKITGQPGFKEIQISDKGVKAATGMAKAIPWVALAVTVIEVGTNIIKNQKAIQAEQIAFYDKLSEINEDNINNLWQVINNYTLSRQDDAHRTADLVVIKTAFNEANNSFRKLSKEASNNKKINDHLVSAMKTALDVYSFSYLLNIMYSNVEDCSEYVNKALEDISGKTEVFNAICDKCYNEYIENSKKHNKLLENTQYNNSNKSKKALAARIGVDVLTGGLAELGSLGSKQVGKKVQKDDEEIIKKLEKIKQSDNPFLEAIKNANQMLLLEKPVLKDDKYLYYQVD